jgi:AraC family transcriptional regulator
MYHGEITHNYNKQINRVINYIMGHLRGDLSLDKLAAIANYSPFHFQKVFKQVVGKTPKQFIMLTKLKSATGFLMIDQPKPVSEIAFNCGFSSPSVFARSFKDHFGLSAEKLRAIPVEERIKLISCETFVKELLHHELPQAVAENHRYLNKVTVKNINSIHGVFTNTSLKDKGIVNCFRKSVQVAETRNIDLAGSRYVGMIYPHHDLYRAFVSFDPGAGIIMGENYTEIKSGRYATFKVSGEIEATFIALNAFYNQWLPNSGYRIADICVFEILWQNPINKAYRDIERDVYVPIEPV